MRGRMVRQGCLSSRRPNAEPGAGFRGTMLKSIPADTRNASDADAHHSFAVRAGRAGHGAHARAEHDLSDLPFDLPGTRRRLGITGRHRTRVHDLSAVRGAGAHRNFLSVPLAYDVLRIAGAIYLLYLAWQALKPGARSPFQVRDLPPDSPHRLFGMGLFTSLLNPKIAILYVSLLPQFMRPEQGSVLVQSLILGSTQIAISVSVNALIVLMAGSVAVFFASRPTWQVVQRWLMGTVLAGLAVRMAVESRR